MKAPGLILISFLVSLVCWSQEVVQDIVSTSGGEFAGATLQIEWTIGEISTETHTNGSFMLSQGFHQGYSVVIKEIPTVVTAEPIVMELTMAIVGGDVVFSGGAAITDRGIYWGTELNPHISGTQISLGTGTGVFSYILDILDPATDYFVIAYATNSEGTSFGDELTFCTVLTPKVSTASVDNITDVSAVVGGEVTCNGGIIVSYRGVYWGLHPEPEVTGTRLDIGDGVGEYYQILQDLVPGTIYFVKAFAINEIGTAFGDEVMFITLSLPTVITAEALNITHESAILGGEVVSDGGHIILERGVYWGTNPNPEISGTQLPMGVGIGEFTQTIENLDPSTVYFFKAYATNSVGTAFGDLKLFESFPSQGGVPAALVISDLIITSTQDTCFSATETITVGGDGALVEIMDGGYLQLIAGQSILLKNGFRVHAGGGFHAYIDTEGNYCLNAKSIIATSTDREVPDIQIPEFVDQISYFSAYPNPTLGSFTIGLIETIESVVKVEIYSILGELLITNEFFGNQQIEMDISDRPKGIYIIRVLCGNQFVTKKMIRK